MENSFRNRLIPCALIGVLMFTSCVSRQTESERPNILFILSDDHTSQAWGIYGGILSDYVKNENIKRLANEGCVLDNCFCTNSISVPSRAHPYKIPGLTYRQSLYYPSNPLSPNNPANDQLDHQLS